MEIQVLSIENGAEVRFKCSAGVGLAIWRGDLPLVGESLDVELDIDDSLEWTVNVSTTQDKGYKIVETDNHYILAAKVVSQESDVLVVDFVGNIVMLDVECMQKDISGWVEICAKELTLSPTNI